MPQTFSDALHGPAQPETAPLRHDRGAPEVLLRFRWHTFGWIAATIVATYVLLPKIGQLGQTIRTLDDAQWQWFAGALAMSAVTYATAALTVLGASPRPLAFGRTMNVQLATSFANLLMPYGLGGTAINERYLERCGLARTTAVATVALTVTTAVALHLIELAGTGVWLGRTRLMLTAALPSGWILLTGFVVVMTALGIGIVIMLRRPAWLTEVRTALGAMAGILRRPRRAAMLIGGQLGTNVAYIATLGISVHAFGGHASTALVATVFLGGSALGAASPTPSGLGVIEAALVTGLMVGGVASAPAVAGVLAYRLATFWIPAAAGFISFKSLQHQRLL
ncbi:lysylphosphatidylglycerol synthase transmembrane domain-containing protein [Nocardia sp. NPDC046473]|uniref:lysylphosphatidylglycerol synthase transmembrane domain-containing protein n=1 Tax=Nocardia sp. NPDC046473 TaxID=3155733 RepID=UPI0033CB6B11